MLILTSCLDALFISRHLKVEEIGGFWSSSKPTRRMVLFHSILKLFEGSSGKQVQYWRSSHVHVFLEEMVIETRAGISRKPRTHYSTAYIHFYTCYYPSKRFSHGFSPLGLSHEYPQMSGWHGPAHSPQHYHVIYYH